MDFNGRIVVFKALVGSHNYNLNTETSDKDYKVFVLPTFNDLYYSKYFNNTKIGELEDFDVHDIRKCESLWYKSNVNFLEVLFSEELLINSELDTKSKLLVHNLYELRHKIAKMNLSYLYDACIGTHHNKIKYLEKGTSSTEYLVHKYGYDTKQAMQAWRILDFLESYSKNNFTDFKAAIWYPKETVKHEILMDIKNGVYSLDSYKEIIKSKLNCLEQNYKEIYKSKPIDNNTNHEISSILKELIKINLK